MKDLICVGKITVAHGIKGYVKIVSYLENPKDINQFDVFYAPNGERTFKIRMVSMQKNIAIAAIEGVVDRNEAEKLRHTELYVPRAALPETQEGVYYWEDLTGLEVELEGGSVYGKVVAMHNFGAGDIIEIHCNKTNKTEMFAFNEYTIPSVDLEAGKLILNPPEIVMVASEKALSDQKRDKSAND